MTTRGWDIDGYDSIEPLGGGGDATVYMVRHQHHRYIRALRIQNAMFDTAHETDRRRYAAFVKQCETLLRIGNGNHSHIIRIAPPQLIRTKAVVEMDYIEGLDVHDYIKENGHFVPIDEVLKLVEQMSSALAFCHYDVYRFSIDANKDKVEMNGATPMNLSEGRIKELVTEYRVVHHDIHDKNIHRKYDGTYILLDFNLAVEGEQVVRRSNRGQGVREFWPIERFEDEQGLDAHTYSDVYSMGILFYEFLTGQLPFSIKKGDKTQGASLRKMHESSPVPDIFERRKQSFEDKPEHQDKIYRKDYPDWLAEVILKMLEKDPASRYQDGKELYNEVSAHLQNDRMRRLDRIFEQGPGDQQEQFAQEANELKQENKTLVKENEEANRKAAEISGHLRDVESRYSQLLANIDGERKNRESTVVWKKSWAVGIILVFLTAGAGMGGYMLAGKGRADSATMPSDLTRRIISREEASKTFQSAIDVINDGGVPNIDSLRPVVILYPEYGQRLIKKLDEVIPNITSDDFKMADEKVRDELRQLILKTDSE